MTALRVEPTPADSHEYQQLFKLVDRMALRYLPPGDRLAALRAVQLAVDEMILREVDDKKRAGWTWEKIGHYLGVTKQAASQLHKRATRLF